MRRFLPIFLLLALIPVGCGGSDDNSSSSGTTTQENAQTQPDTKQSDGKSGSKDKKKGSNSGSSRGGSGSAGSGGSSVPGTTTGDQAPAPTGSPLAKKAFIRKADQACREFTRNTQDIADPGNDQSAAAEGSRKIANEGEKLYRKFAALPKPRGDVRVLTRYQDLLKQNYTVTRQIADAIENNDAAAGTQAIETSRNLAAETARLARRYGFHACA
jgi:hypothetical protein